MDSKISLGEKVLYKKIKCLDTAIIACLLARPICIGEYGHTLAEFTKMLTKTRKPKILLLSTIFPDCITVSLNYV